MIFEMALSSLPLQGTLMLPFLGEGFLVTIYLDILLRASNSMQYREGNEVFSVVTCPVEYGTGDPCGSVNKLVLGIKHSSNESLAL
jgi:hypothetical protein